MELAGAGASLAGLVGLNLTGPARSVITGCQRRLTVDDRAAEVQVGFLTSMPGSFTEPYPRRVIMARPTG